jgi:hypothetical protein
MIHGHKPNAYFVTATGDGLKIEGETRQCCHCQFTWEYAPGSGTRRGWCLKHNGFVCCRPECQQEQEQMLAKYALATGKVVSCLAFEEWCDFLKEQIGKTPGQLSKDFTITPGGIIVPL